MMDIEDSMNSEPFNLDSSQVVEDKYTFNVLMAENTHSPTRFMNRFLDKSGQKVNGHPEGLQHYEKDINIKKQAEFLGIPIEELIQLRIMKNDMAASLEEMSYYKTANKTIPSSDLMLRMIDKLDRTEQKMKKKMRKQDVLKDFHVMDMLDKIKMYFIDKMDERSQSDYHTLDGLHEWAIKEYNIEAKIVRKFEEWLQMGQTGNRDSLVFQYKINEIRKKQYGIVRKQLITCLSVLEAQDMVRKSKKSPNYKPTHKLRQTMLLGSSKSKDQIVKVASEIRQARNDVETKLKHGLFLMKQLQELRQFRNQRKIQDQAIKLQLPLMGISYPKNNTIMIKHTSSQQGIGMQLISRRPLHYFSDMQLVNLINDMDKSKLNQN